MLLARRGYRVLCVDQALFPKDAVSTHMLRQSGLARLRDWGLLEQLKATGCTPIHSITMSYADAQFSGFSDPIDGIAETYAPRRIVLDTLLQDAARSAGVDLREGVTVLDLVREGSRSPASSGATATANRSSNTPASSSAPTVTPPPWPSSPAPRSTT